MIDTAVNEEPPSVLKPETIRDLGPVEIARLKTMVGQISEGVWNQENSEKENNFNCFHHTRHIVFRFIGGMADHRKYYSNPIWNVWQDMLMPIMQNAVKPYEFSNPQFPKVMLARLAAGHVIDMHRDGAGANLHTHKIHIPLTTNPKAKFHIEDESFHLHEGGAFEVNNIKRHGVENLGSEDRVHFIFEVFDAQ